jgi:hypothetical protein
MASSLSTDKIESKVNELGSALSKGDWKDSVKDSYVRFVEDEKNIVSELQSMVEKANSLYNDISRIDIGQINSAYGNCASQLSLLKSSI